MRIASPSHKKFFSFAFLALTTTLNSYAAEAPTAYDDPSGVSVEFDNDGGWKRIRAVGESSCAICDRKDIVVSKRKAELSAKAYIAKFLGERITTDEVMEEMTKTLSEHNGQSENVNRKSVETLTTTIRNSADQILKGVVVLESTSNPASKLIKVTVGVSRKTMRAADSVRGAINSDTSRNSTSPSGAMGKNQPGMEVQRSKNYDDF